VLSGSPFGMMCELLSLVQVMSKDRKSACNTAWFTPSAMAKCTCKLLRLQTVLPVSVSPVLLEDYVALTQIRWLRSRQRCMQCISSLAYSFRAYSVCVMYVWHTVRHAVCWVLQGNLCLRCNTRFVACGFSSSMRPVPLCCRSWHDQISLPAS